MTPAAAAHLAISPLCSSLFAEVHAGIASTHQKQGEGCRRDMTRRPPHMLHASPLLCTYLQVCVGPSDCHCRFVLSI